MLDREGMVFRMELLASKDGGERVPLVVEFYRPELQEDKYGHQIWFVSVLDGVIHRKMQAFGLEPFFTVCMGIAMAKTQLEHFYFLNGYRMFRRVGEGDEYVEVGLEDLFPYTREIGK